jgi:hypothetical protein
MFQLSAAEWSALRSQSVTLKAGRGQHRKYLPYAFTEHGVAMLSSVLRSERAIAVNIQIMRAFVRMRELLASNRALARRLDELEARLEKKLPTHDQAIAAILSAIRQLMHPPDPQAPAHRFYRRSRGKELIPPGLRCLTTVNKTRSSPILHPLVSRRPGTLPVSKHDR